MTKLEQLIERIIERVNINLRELKFNARPYVRHLVDTGQLARFYAFYGITPHHPLNFFFQHCNLAGSHFLGKCAVKHSVLYKSDIRGDELKSKGDIFSIDGYDIPVHDDEEIRIYDSLLIKTLVHNFSHDPENLETFTIQNTVSTHFANIHGSPTEGCFLGPFSTVDLTTVHDSVIGSFSYVQAGEAAHLNVEPGTVWIKNGETFNFLYRFPAEVLQKYIRFEPGRPPEGIFMEFVQARKADFEGVFNVMNREAPIFVPESAALNRYAVVKGETRLGENVLVAQRAFLEDAVLGKGANAQENCYITRSRLEGCNVTAHGAKITDARLGEKVFVGFNAFLRGAPDARLEIGKESIIMPHTIIDLEEPLSIPAGRIVWGYIRNRQDLAENSLSIEAFSQVTEGLLVGSMVFQGNGAEFVSAFKHRIDHILEANGAYYNGDRFKGHSQKNQNISFNTIQPYPEGELAGIYPTIIIRP